MKNVRFSRRAARDLIEIYKYIARDNVTAANNTIQKIRHLCLLLAETPKLGRVRPDVGNGIRYFPVSTYNVFFTVKGGQIFVVRVLHGRRDLWRALHY